ncbi:MAG: NAD(P)/FAD-dependent oxidoreductase, partial [Acetobacteraceae bacterium]
MIVTVNQMGAEARSARERSGGTTEFVRRTVIPAFVRPCDESILIGRSGVMRVAIIGAGIVGASAAWHLARAGAEPVLIDAGLDGRATAAGAGIVAPWAGSSAPDPDWHRRGVAAGRDYPAVIAALAEDGEVDTGYARCGALIVNEDPAILARVARDLLARRKTAPEMGEISVLDPAQAQAAFPPLHPALGAVHVAGGARVDGRRLAASLVRAAVRHGAREMHGMASLV